MRSFIRLRQRISVDLPHPDGPIRAVISLRAMSKLTSRTAGFPAYETVRSSRWKIGSRGRFGSGFLPSAAGGGSGVSIRISGGSVTGFATLDHLPLLLVSVS